MLPNPRRLRAGYSMIELLIVTVILSSIFAMVSPRVTAIRDSSTLRAGHQ